MTLLPQQRLFLVFLHVLDQSVDLCSPPKHAVSNSALVEDTDANDPSDNTGDRAAMFPADRGWHSPNMVQGRTSSEPVTRSWVANAK